MSYTISAEGINQQQFFTFCVFIFKYFIFDYVHLCGGVDVSSVPTNVRRESDPMEPQLQVAANCPIWMLGTELGSSAGAVSILNL